MGFFSTLTLILIVLKLMNYISWSWWVVLLGPIGIWAAMVVLVITIHDWVKKYF